MSLRKKSNFLHHIQDEILSISKCNRGSTRIHAVPYTQIYTLSSISWMPENRFKIWYTVQKWLCKTHLKCKYIKCTSVIEYFTFLFRRSGWNQVFLIRLRLTGKLKQLRTRSWAGLRGFILASMFSWWHPARWKTPPNHCTLDKSHRYKSRSPWFSDPVFTLSLQISYYQCHFLH